MALSDEDYQAFAQKLGVQSFANDGGAGGGSVDAADLAGAAVGQDPNLLRGAQVADQMDAELARQKANPTPANFPDRAPPQAPAEPAAAAPVYHPATWGETPFYRPGTLKKYDEANQNLAMGRADATDMAAVSQDAQTQEIQAYANWVRDKNERDAAQEQVRNEQFDAKRKEARRLSDEAASAKVEPGKIFADGGAGMAIMVAIGGALGGFLQARTGGANQFLETINRIQDKDIAAQRANIDQLHNKAAGARAELGDLRTQLGDQRLAEVVQRDRQLGWVESKVKAIASSAQSDDIRARAKDILNQLQVQRAGMQMEMDKISWRAPYVSGGQPAGQKTNRELTIRMPDGRVYEAPTKEAADKFRQNMDYTLGIQNNINEALAIRKSMSAADWANPLSAGRKKLKSLAAETAQIKTVREGQGAMSEGDKQVANEAIGAMTGPMSNNDDVLRATHARAGKRLDLGLDAMGAEQIKTGYTVDPQGNTQTTRQYTGQAVKPPAAMPKLNPIGGK